MRSLDDLAKLVWEEDEKTWAEAARELPSLGLTLMESEPNKWEDTNQAHYRRIALLLAEAIVGDCVEASSSFRDVLTRWRNESAGQA